ncbi:MAG TPA: protein-glutamate O-methyltransferase CheR [Candidatus Wallbacteria bacterium]|nr:protein-glutamate O-methyltransferase CheR [Candidatus Wallbacteria bacterium]
MDKMKKRGKIDLRIWCAGCSSGEEPYSVAMVISNFFEENKISGEFGVLATDISVTSIEKAGEGVYQAAQLAHVPPQMRHKYFTMAGDENVIVKANLKKNVLFRRLNLMRDIYPFKGLFNIIFCRNVMIYFDGPTRKTLIEKYHRYTEAEGYLFIGHSESIDRSSQIYKYIKPAVYQKI